MIHFAKLFSKLIMDKNEVTFHMAQAELVRYMAIELTWIMSNLAYVESAEAI